jgi:hypothetical protein
MADEGPSKFKTRVSRKGDITRVRVPNEILAQVTLADKEIIQIFVNDKGNIELETSKKAADTVMCMICNSVSAKRKCINCGRLACANCFWELGGLCRKCAKMK